MTYIISHCYMQTNVGPTTPFSLSLSYSKFAIYVSFSLVDFPL